MYNCVINYPITTLKVLFTNTINVFVSDNLLSSITPYFGYQWKIFKNSCYLYKTSKTLFYSTYILMISYVVLWIFFFWSLCSYFLKKDYATVFMIGTTFIMFIVPSILTGDGGGRFRLPFENILFIYSIQMILQKFKYKKTNTYNLTR
jgi:hypothetical protein